MDEKLAILQQNLVVLQYQQSEINRRLDVLHEESVTRPELEAVKKTADSTSETLKWIGRIVFGIVIAAVVGLVVTTNPLQ